MASGSLPIVTREAFLASLDDNGKAVFSRILDLGKEKSMPIHWGTRGFSLNVDMDGIHVAVCFGYPEESVYTALLGRGGLATKTAVPEDVVKALWGKATSSGLFIPAGHELKCLINRTFSEDEISSLLAWLEEVAKTVSDYGLKE